MIPLLALHSEPERQTPVVSSPPTLTRQASWGKFTTWTGFNNRPRFFSSAVFPRAPRTIEAERDPRNRASSILTGSGVCPVGITDTVFVSNQTIHQSVTSVVNCVWSRARLSGRAHYLDTALHSCEAILNR